MSYSTKLKNASVKDPDSRLYKTYSLLDSSLGCTNGCKAGVTVFLSDEYNPAGTHDDQEGYYVLSGTGFAKVDGQEIALEPDMSLIVPAGKTHCMKRSPSCDGLKVFWFHAAK